MVISKYHTLSLPDDLDFSLLLTSGSRLTTLDKLWELPFFDCYPEKSKNHPKTTGVIKCKKEKLLVHG